MNLLLNSRLGRNVDELVTDWVVRSWHHLHSASFWPCSGFITDSSTSCSKPWNAFCTQSTNGPASAAANIASWRAKALLGLFWAVVAYVVRFFVNLLIEPQVNPIKHFPVVTVSHKIISPGCSRCCAVAMGPPMQLGQSGPIGLPGDGLLLPGVVGFLVWELKENWRLYAANRLANCNSHRRPPGETIDRLLRPGFHSGTVPKLFARLRRAERKRLVTGKWRRLPVSLATC